jgi:hypothetical protein
VLPEHAVIFYPDDVICIIWVIVAKVQQNFELDASLVLELFFVSYYLDSYDFSGFVVNALESLSEGPLAKEVYHLEPISNVVLDDYIVVAPLVIVPKVVLLGLRSFDLVGSKAEEVTYLIIEDFAFFVLGKSLLLEVMLEDLGT